MCFACIIPPSVKVLSLSLIVFMWTTFKVHMKICYNIASVLCFGSFCCEACEILSSGTGIKPTPPVLKGKVLTTGPPGTSHILSILDEEMEVQ